MHIKVSKKGDHVILSAVGEMDAYDAEKFEKEGLAAIEENENNIVIDFTKLDYISSSGLRALLNLRSLSKNRGKRLILVGIRKNVLEVFRVSKLLQLFELREDMGGLIKP